MLCSTISSSPPSLFRKGCAQSRTEHSKNPTPLLLLLHGFSLINLCCLGRQGSERPARRPRECLGGCTLKVAHHQPQTVSTATSRERNATKPNAYNCYPGSFPTHFSCRSCLSFSLNFRLAGTYLLVLPTSETRSKQSGKADSPS